VLHENKTTTGKQPVDFPFHASAGTYRWFFHPMDAYLLGSIVLSDDNICQPFKRPIDQVSLLILDRLHDRTFGNRPEILSYFEGQMATLNLTSAKGMFFENLSLFQQARVMRNADILLTVHGAGETNIAFMPPCSAVIELFPAHYVYLDFFRSLAVRSGLLHYHIMGTKEQTRNSPECDRFIAEHEADYLKNTSQTSIYASPAAQKAFADYCWKITACRKCGSRTYSVSLDTAVAHQVIKRAMKDRQKCITQHPMFNLSSPATEVTAAAVTGV
jgi:hypothetical protein